MMMIRLLHRHRIVLALTIAFLAVACIISSHTEGTSVSLNATQHISSPMKAHLLDGSIAVFDHGGDIANRQISGTGMRYDPTLKTAVAVTAPIPLDSVVGVETFERVVNPGRTLLYSTLATAGTIIGATAAAVAIFGSCPTIYVDSAGTQVLQAESFSYSIAPLLAKRDVDRLQVASDGSGVVRLTVRNEALETHYVDQIELLEASHAPDELALPAARVGIIAVRHRVAGVTMHDRAGRNLADVLGAADERVFATDSLTLDRASRGGPADDYIDVTIPSAPGRDSVAIVLRARSSLLTTMLLYDEMLAGQGAKALDYVGKDLQRVTKLAQLADWYVKNLGLRVSVVTNDGREQRQIVRLVDFGPAAWRDVAVVVPATADHDSVHVRLAFLADAFRIDHLQVFGDLRELAPRSVPIARVLDRDGKLRPDAREVLLRTDDLQLQTWPGHEFKLEFDVGGDRTGIARTYFIAAQGYYTEWMRGRWLATDSTTDFAPLRKPVAPILQRWLITRDSLEQTFFRQRVPIV